MAAKLDALLRQGEWCEDCPEFPWPQLRSAFEDLLRLGDLGAYFAQCVARQEAEALQPLPPGSPDRNELTLRKAFDDLDACRHRGADDHLAGLG